MRDETKKSFDRIVDTITGADGGVSFVMLRNIVIDMDNQAATGDRAAETVITTIHRFAALIDAAEKLHGR